MVKRCCVYGCSNIYIRKSEISIHSFPIRPKLREAWFEAIGRERYVPYNALYVCSEHFLPELINRTYASGTVHLRDGAIPTIFNSYPSITVPGVLRSRNNRTRKTPLEDPLSEPEIIIRNKTRKKLRKVHPLSDVGSNTSADVGRGTLAGIGSGTSAGVGSGSLVDVTRGTSAGVASSTVTGIGSDTSAGVGSGSLVDVARSISAGVASSTVTGIGSGTLVDVTRGTSAGVGSGTLVDVTRGTSAGVASNTVTGIGSGTLVYVGPGILAYVDSNTLADAGLSTLAYVRSSTLPEAGSSTLANAAPSTLADADPSSFAYTGSGTLADTALADLSSLTDADPRTLAHVGSSTLAEAGLSISPDLRIGTYDVTGVPLVVYNIPGKKRPHENQSCEFEAEGTTAKEYSAEEYKRIEGNSDKVQKPRKSEPSNATESHNLLDACIERFLRSTSNIVEEDCSEFNFLRSILPDVKQMDPQQQFMFRSAILQSIGEILYDLEFSPAKYR